MADDNKDVEEKKEPLVLARAATQTHLMMSIMKNADLAVSDAVDSLQGEPNLLDQERIRMTIEANMIAKLKAPAAFELANVLPSIAQGVELIAQDDFSRCFRENPPEPWNWNAYLYVLWCLGVVFRYVILLPLRILSLLLGFILFAIGFATVRFVYKSDKHKRQSWERRLIRFLAGSFVFSWHGVIRYHGVIPKRAVNQIYVANHTSMIDLIILEQMNTFSAVGQKHPGWVGFLQNDVLGCLGCIWFNRNEQNDRKLTSTKIKEHIMNPDSNRLLIFPEGTCVNNEYCVQFKKGAFEFDATICPIAIKYNKTFVDAFWNSRRRPFHLHLYDLMRSWAVVCDVWYLDPQTRRQDETPIQFAARVKRMITKTAGLIDVDYDGYMKYFIPSEKFIREKQKLFAESLQRRMNQNLLGTSPRAAQKKTEEQVIVNRKDSGPRSIKRTVTQ